MKSKIENYARVRLGFLKNILPQTLRYFRAYFKSVSYNQVLMRDVLLLSHALEKGFIYSNPRKGWGKAKAQELLGIIKYLLSSGISPNEYEIQEACSVLKTYAEVKANESDKQLLLDVNDIILKNNIELLPGGSKIISEKELFAAQDPIEFISSRRSVRFFSGDVVSKDVVLKAISIANTTPSACNKQPSRVYCPFNKESIERIAGYFKNAYAFENFPQILIVTSKLSVFSSDEYLQPLINGGMYADTLCLAFHALGIGTCPLEMVPFKGPEKEIRKICKIEDDEIIVTALAIGYVNNENKCTCGARRNNNQVFKEIEV